MNKLLKMAAASLLVAVATLTMTVPADASVRVVPLSESSCC